MSSPQPINKEKPIYQSLVQNVKKVCNCSFKVIVGMLKFDANCCALYC